jgi:hypothetical protein
MGRRKKQDTKQAKFVCEDCNNEFFVPPGLFDVVGVLCDRCNSDKTYFVEFVEVVNKDMGAGEVEEVVKSKSFIDPESLNEGDFYYWVSPNFKDSYKLVELVRLIDEEFCEVRLENEVLKTKRTNLKIEKIEV